ncbi:MAG: hypothetical protein IKQ46_12140 [Bacteroidales bacterium]|nr:hypothetical protein [Bacteroidales bacterium]
MKKNVLVIIGACIIAFLIAYSFTLNRNNKVLANNQVVLSKKLIENERNVHCLMQNYIYSNKHINERLDSFLTISGRVDNLDNIYHESDSVILICRISENHCSACTKYAIDLARNSGYKKMLFLAKNEKKHSLRNLIESYNIDTNKIRSLEMEIATADCLMYPYFLFVNKENKILSIYIPFEANNENDQRMISLMLDEYNKV